MDSPTHVQCHHLTETRLNYCFYLLVSRVISRSLECLKQSLSSLTVQHFALCRYMRDRVRKILALITKLFGNSSCHIRIIILFRKRCDVGPRALCKALRFGRCVMPFDGHLSRNAKHVDSCEDFWRVVFDVGLKGYGECIFSNTFLLLDGRLEMILPWFEN